MTHAADRPPRLVVAIGGSEVRDDVAGLVCDGDRLCVLGPHDDPGPALDDLLATLTTGWRIVAVGAERDAHLVRAALLARGALDEEITVVAAGTSGGRRVLCGHCHHGVDTSARVGEVLRCPGCGIGIAVAAHVSRVHGAHLGAPV